MIFFFWDILMRIPSLDRGRSLTKSFLGKNTDNRLQAQIGDTWEESEAEAFHHNDFDRIGVLRGAPIFFLKRATLISGGVT
jgi:hypothetical protein